MKEHIVMRTWVLVREAGSQYPTAYPFESRDHAEHAVEHDLFFDLMEDTCQFLELVEQDEAQFDSNVQRAEDNTFPNLTWHPLTTTSEGVNE